MPAAVSSLAAPLLAEVIDGNGFSAVARDGGPAGGYWRGGEFCSWLWGATKQRPISRAYGRLSN